LERKKANGSQPNIDKNMYRAISTARATAAERIAGRITTLKNEPHPSGHVDRGDEPLAVEVSCGPTLATQML
jgi:hypothetical protein